MKPRIGQIRNRADLNHYLRGYEYEEEETGIKLSGSEYQTASDLGLAWKCKQSPLAKAMIPPFFSG
jgi:hypothetical protein